MTTELVRAICMLIIFETLSAINVPQRIERKSNNGKQENYIITHYGLEYYTPVDEAASDIQPKSGSATGYFTAEVIPVDVHTGEQLKTVNNLYVPLHTGYAIDADTKHNVFANHRKDDKSQNPTDVIKTIKQSTPHEKKFKLKLATATKKPATNGRDDGNIHLGETENRKKS